MRVTFVAINYAPSVGGAQWLVQRVAEGLVTNGHEVEVLTTDNLLPPAGRSPGHIDLAEEIIGGVRVRRFPSARRTQRAILFVIRVKRKLRIPERRGLPAGYRFGPLSPKMALAARRSARTADVLVGVSAPFLTVPGSQWATAGRRARHVSQPLLHLPGGFPSRRQLGTFKRSSRCVTITEFERSWLIQQGLDPARIAVLPPGCDPDAFPDVDAEAARHQQGLRPGLTIGYVGRLAAHKGIDTFLSALPSVWERHPDLNVVVAGARTGWGDVESLLATTATIGGERFAVRESFTTDEKPLLYAALDLVVFPSREESFGMITLEAWCARRPVIAPDIEAVRCVVTPGVDGELIPPGDIAALTEAICGLLEDPARAARFAVAGRARAEADYRWAEIVDHWDELLRSIIADAPLARAGSN